MNKPKFKHDCEDCTFLFHYDEIDVYHCENSSSKDGSILFRYSDEPSGNISYPIYVGVEQSFIGRFCRSLSKHKLYTKIMKAIEEKKASAKVMDDNPDNKCKWVDGEFKPCETANKRSLELRDRYNLSITYCPYCGADIRKPEPEVIIKKSGGTWVKRENGIDLLWICHTDGHESMNPDNWKPISEIEITDEIAKLRPLIVWEHPDIEGSDILKLLAVGEGVFNCACFNGRTKEYDGYSIKHIRLASTSDLEDS